MNLNFKIAFIAVLVLGLGACRSADTIPADTLTSTATAVPSATATLALTDSPLPTETPIPTKTATETLPPPTTTATSTPIPPTETPSGLDLPLPSGTPQTNWEGLPIMPGAIAGEGDSAGYTFTIKAPIEEIQAFYARELAPLGWDLFASGQGGTDAVMLIFMQGSGTLSVSIIPLSDDLVYVLLVK